MNTILKTGWIVLAVTFVVLVVTGLTGCVITLPKWPDGGTVIPPALTNAIPPVVTETKPETTDELDLSTVKWHGPDIRGWPIAAELQASIRGGDIVLITDLLKGRAATGDNGTTGNPWAIAKGTDGKWHAYTFEWTDASVNRQKRTLSKAFDRGHGCPSVCTNAGVKGAEFYVAVATVSRGGKKSNGDVRTPFRKVVHP